LDLQRIWGRWGPTRRCVYASVQLAVCGNSSVGRAQPCQGWGRGFESRFPLWIGGLTDRRTGGQVDGRTRETRNDAVSQSACPTVRQSGRQTTRGGAAW